MTNQTESEQKSLKQLLTLHTDYGKQIEELYAKTHPDESAISQLKKRKLRTRTAIASGDYYRKTPITEVDTYPLTDDTLQLVRDRLQVELNFLISGCVNQTSRRYVEKKREHDTVVRVLETRRLEKLTNPQAATAEAM